jgi:hypothetical protein
MQEVVIYTEACTAYSHILYYEYFSSHKINIIAIISKD